MNNTDYFTFRLGQLFQLNTLAYKHLNIVASSPPKVIHDIWIGNKIGIPCPSICIQPVVY